MSRSNSRRRGSAIGDRLRGGERCLGVRQGAGDAAQIDEQLRRLGQAMVVDLGVGGDELRRDDLVAVALIAG